MVDLNSSFKSLPRTNTFTNCGSDETGTAVILRKDKTTKPKHHGFLRTLYSAASYSPSKAISKIENMVISVNLLPKIANSVANVIGKVRKTLLVFSFHVVTKTISFLVRTNKNDV